MKLQKLGGYAAIATVCVYISAVLIYRCFGLPDDPIKAMEAYEAAPVFSCVGLFLLTAAYILGLAVALALHERMHALAPYLTRVMLIASSVAAAFGFLETVVYVTGMDQIAPTRDISVYKAFIAVFDGIHTAGGQATGWSCLFAGWAVLKTRSFSLFPGWLGIATGILWVSDIIPQLPVGDTATFMLLVFYIWIGIELLRKKPIETTAKEITIAL